MVSNLKFFEKRSSNFSFYILYSVIP